jgi:hypothetical protein
MSRADGPFRHFRHGKGPEGISPPALFQIIVPDQPTISSGLKK